MPADGKVKYNARNARYCNMGIDDFIYRYTAQDARNDRVRLMGELEMEQRERDIQRSNIANHAGFIANDSIRNLSTLTHKKYGKGKLIEIVENVMRVHFPKVGIIDIPLTDVRVGLN